MGLLMIEKTGIPVKKLLMLEQQGLSSQFQISYHWPLVEHFNYLIPL